MIPYSRLCCTVYPVKMLLETMILLPCLAVSLDITPIGELTKNRLQTIQDEVDTRGEGFAALLEHVNSWDGEVEMFTAPNRAALLESPERYRGDIFTVSGEVELKEVLPAPWNGVLELFVRDGDGLLYGLYISADMDLPLHQVIQAPALFYKTIAMKGRDDQWRVYPTFVTSNVFITSSANQQLVPNAFLAVVLFGLVAFVWYWIITMTRRKRLPQPRGRIRTHDVLRAAEETAGELPEIPSEALAAMYHRSEGTE